MNSLLRWFNEQAWWEKSGAADYYRGLSQRDQRIAQAVVALLLASLLFLLVWRPVAHWRERNQARFDDAQETLQWMHANQAQAQASSAGQGRAPGTSLLAVVGDVARELGLTLSRFQPEGADGVSVVLQNEEFDNVLRFVDRLEAHHGLTVRQFSFDRQAAGRVTARLVIQ